MSLPLSKIQHCVLPMVSNNPNSQILEQSAGTKASNQPNECNRQ